jgi:uncharacterized protein YbcI
VPAADPPDRSVANGDGEQPEPDAGGAGPDVLLHVAELSRFRVQRVRRIHRRRLSGAGPGDETMTSRPTHPDGRLAAAISNSVVKALARTTGRGPTQAKTTLGDNGVFVVLQDSLTVGEQTLTDAGQGQAVLDLRRRWQSVMQADISREIEQLTGRKVVGFMSDNHIDPDLAVEVFVLEPLPAPSEDPGAEQGRQPA